MTRTAGVIGALLLVLGASAGIVALADPTRADVPARTVPPPAAIAWVEQAQRGCGSVREHTWERGLWRCVLSDDFDGNAVDLTRWNPATTAASDFSAGVPPGYVCYLYDPRTVSVGGGLLHLSVVELDRKLHCGGIAAQPTHFIGGALSTKHRLPLTYGRFEVRARFATAHRPGLQSSIQLRPDKHTYGRKSGEIDIAEYFTVWPKRVFPVVRYDHRGDDPTAHNDKCMLPQPNAFHTYTAQWTPDRIELEVDGKACVSTAWTMGDELSRPAPFDRPFFLALFQALGSSKAGYDPEDSPDFPATMDVDHVYIWGHVTD